MESVVPSQSQIANLSDKHCIFQCGDSVFSLPATSVREVTMMPPIVAVPLSHPSLAGIGNIRSEFLPVIDLEPLIGNQASLSSANGQLLVIESPLGGWAITIDKVISIDVIETHVDADTRNDSAASILMGTATYDGKVISVLDVNGLQRIAQQTQEAQWNRLGSFTSPQDNSHSTAPESNLV